MHRSHANVATTIALATFTFSVGLAPLQVQSAPPSGSPGAEHARIVEHWTPERRAAAIPRDLVIDERGQGYLKHPDGRLIPYGRTIADGAGSMTPQARPGSGSDTTPPTVGSLDPAANATIGGSHTFKATVTDAGGVRSVTFRVGRAGSTQQSFAASQGANNVWTVSLQGFTDGSWTWSVSATDNARNTTTTVPTAFTVDTSIGGGGGGSTSDGTVVTNQNVLTLAGATTSQKQALSRAVGRIFFEMPTNVKRTRWAGYVCSGTVVTDDTTGRSIIQTAAHCVYDDANKAFARNVLFIPNQAGTTAAGTDRTCSNDPIGCWSTWFGVVDVNWTTRTFPDNVAWDYAYYVVRDSGAYQPGAASVGSVLDASTAAGSVGISFALPQFSVSGSTVDYTHAIGYSYSDDPNLMYCAEDLANLDDANWWLGSCGLSGGSSGGAWMQPVLSGTGLGSLISVNSWGYTNQPGMAGPKLFGTSATNVFGCAKTAVGPAAAGDGNAGLKYPGECPKP